MARRATSLGPKPSLFVFLFLFCFCFVLFFAFYFGGFKGQVRWPEGPPHLALNPPYLFFLFVFFLFVFFFFASFPFFVFNRKNLFFPIKRAFFGLFSVFPFLSPLTFFGLPLFHFLFLCLSVLLLSFFLPSCLSFLAFFFFLVFVSFFCSIFCAFVSWKEHENIKLEFLFFIKMFSFLGFLSCFLFEISFPYLCFFPDFELCFLFNIICFWFQKNKLKNTFFQKKGGCNKTVFFYEPVFCKMSKVIVFFFGIFFAFFWLFFKKHYKNRHFSTFFKAKNYKKMAFLEVIIWSKLEVIIWSKLTAS